MKNKTHEREKRENMLTKMVSENHQLMDFIARHYKYDVQRMEILKGILSQMGTFGNQQVKDDIYLYGSMIRQRDLVARQIFLWLLGLVEEAEQTELR